MAEAIYHLSMTHALRPHNKPSTPPHPHTPYMHIFKCIKPLSSSGGYMLHHKPLHSGLSCPGGKSI